MTLEEQHDLRVILKALHCGTVHDSSEEVPEQRGNAYGPPS
jgi:hypothetical protein